MINDEKALLKMGIKEKWRLTLLDNRLKKKFVLVGCFLIPTLSSLPNFFQFIEKREGIVLNDFILNNLPAIDVSIYIFMFIWTLSILMVVRAVQTPTIFIGFVTSFLLLTLCRIITISIFSFNPPQGLIILKDPLSNFFYGNTFITKDLFFSGHTSTMFLMFLCFQRKFDKLLGVIFTFMVGILVLLQHVHYTVDVIVAPFFTYLIYRLSYYWLYKTK
jgi:PAP2 superfamily C-terminal